MGSFLQSVKFFEVCMTSKPNWKKKKKKENCICTQFLFNHGKNAITVSLQSLSNTYQIGSNCVLRLIRVFKFSFTTA